MINIPVFVIHTILNINILLNFLLFFSIQIKKLSDPASDGSREVVYVVNDAGEPVKGAQAAKTIAQVPEKEMKKILGVKVRLQR